MQAGLPAMLRISDAGGELLRLKTNLKFTHQNIKTEPSVRIGLTLSPLPKECFPPAYAWAHDRDWTDDLSLTMGVLYQLSYMGLGDGGQVPLSYDG